MRLRASVSLSFLPLVLSLTGAAWPPSKKSASNTNLGSVQIVARMEAAAAQAAGGGQGTQEAPLPRLALFSGHDTTIMPLLVTLGGDLSHWPAYVSNLVLSRPQKCMCTSLRNCFQPGADTCAGSLHCALVLIKRVDDLSRCLRTHALVTLWMRAPWYRACLTESQLPAWCC